MSKVRWIGLDVHAETIAVAVAEPTGEVRTLGMIPNRPESIRKLVKKLGPVGALRVCYEAGPTGYVIYWQLTALGVPCEVVAPTLVPMKAGDRVKTDRRDAVKLARSYRAGDLTAVWVPDAAHEALRDLVRAREAAKKDQLRARHRLGKFLLRHGRRPPTAMTPWTQRHLTWITPGAVRAAGAGGDAAGLPPRSGARGRADRAARAGDRRGGARGPAAHARGDRGAAGAARHRADLGGDDRRGSRRALAVCARAAADGLLRPGPARALQRRAHAAGRDHQDRQRASAAHRRRGRLGLSASAGRRRRRCGNARPPSARR